MGATSRAFRHLCAKRCAEERRAALQTLARTIAAEAVALRAGGRYALDRFLSELSQQNRRLILSCIEEPALLLDLASHEASLACWMLQRMCEFGSVPSRSAAC